MRGSRIALVLLLLICNLAHAGDEPFADPANWGGTGLMEIPSARVLREGRFRVGVSQIDPYRYYYGAVSPLKGLEVGGRITEVLGVPAPGFPDYGNYRDKAIDLKYQFIPEGKYLPAVALGIMDLHGTRLYASQYVVASKQIFPFDFTVGYGNGRYGKQPIVSQGGEFGAEIFSNPGEWLSDSLFFAGIQFAPSKYFTLMAEYSPIRYQVQTQDPAQPKYFQDAVPSKFNFGIRLKPVEWAEIDLSYQRGNQFGVNFSAAFDLGVPFIPIYDSPFKENAKSRMDPLTRRLVSALYASGFSNIGVMEEGYELRVEAENNKYYYTPKAIGVMLKIVSEIAPVHIQVVHVILSENGIPVLEFTTTKEDMADFFGGKMTAAQFYYLSQLRTDIDQSLSVKKERWQFFDYGLAPQFSMFLNDPSGYLKYRLGAQGWLSYRPWHGAYLIGGLAGYPVNTVSTSNEPLSRPVRSDIVNYMDNAVSLDRLMFEQIVKTKHDIYGMLSGGLLEVEYGGVDGQVAMPFFNGRILLGLSGSIVKKRDPDNTMQFKKDDWTDSYKTGFVNGRLNIPELEMTFDVQAGQFLAGDRGAKFTVSKFFNGVILSAWYTATDTSIFTDSFNSGYHDKGIAVMIPIRLFIGKDSRTVYKFSLSPWTRDVGQDIDRFTNLFDYIGRNARVYLEKDWSRLQ